MKKIKMKSYREETDNFYKIHKVYAKLKEMGVIKEYETFERYVQYWMARRGECREHLEYDEEGSHLHNYRSLETQELENYFRELDKKKIEEQNKKNIKNRIPRTKN